jgi:hypothetical protein
VKTGDSPIRRCNVRDGAWSALVHDGWEDVACPDPSSRRE